MYLLLGKNTVAFYDDQRSTIQCENCELILPPSRKRCGSCEEYRQVLNRMLYRILHEDKQQDDRVDCQSHTNYRRLTNEEKCERLKNLHSKTVLLTQKLDRLKAKVDSLVEERGVFVEDDLHEHLTDILSNSTDVIAASHPEDSFAHTFWQAQCKALSLSKMTSMKWDPVIIKWCLYLRHLSGGRAYEMLRESGVVKLPSQRTLRDYTYYTETKCGFSDDVDLQLVEVANLNTCKEKDKYVILLMDEMHIKEDLVYDKHSGNI